MPRVEGACVLIVSVPGAHMSVGGVEHAHMHCPVKVWLRRIHEGEIWIPTALSGCPNLSSSTQDSLSCLHALQLSRHSETYIFLGSGKKREWVGGDQMWCLLVDCHTSTIYSVLLVTTTSGCVCGDCWCWAPQGSEQGSWRSECTKMDQGALLRAKKNIGEFVFCFWQCVCGGRWFNCGVEKRDYELICWPCPSGVGTSLHSHSQLFISACATVELLPSTVYFTSLTHSTGKWIKSLRCTVVLF